MEWNMERMAEFNGIWNGIWNEDPETLKKNDKNML